jgi:transmembrane sensor
MAKRETSAEIDVAAARWATLRDIGPLPDDEQEALDLWLAGDNRRLGAYAKACAVLSFADKTRALGPNFRPAVEPGANDEPRLSRRRLFQAGALAAVGVAVSAGALRYLHRTVYRTQRGEIRLVPLSDGSAMTLNTISRVLVNYTPEKRSIELADGEALFEVAKNSQRPFIVTADDVQVRAVGTSFAILRKPNGSIQILVREGVVEVRRSKLSTAPIRVSANMRVVIDHGSEVNLSVLSPADVQRALAWREGMIALEDMTLGEAVDEFSRYNAVRIRLADPTLAQLPITGLFSASDPEGFGRAAASSLDLNVSAGGAEIVLSR